MIYIQLYGDVTECIWHYSEIAPSTYIYDLYISARHVCEKEPHI